MDYKTSDFDYFLPQELIAQTPVEPRDSSRLLVYDRQSKTVEHKHFRDIIDYLTPQDALVINDTRVIPARLIGKREDTGGSVEFLLLKRVDRDEWEALSKPARRVKPGLEYTFADGCLKCTVTQSMDEGIKHIRFTYEGTFEAALDKAGVMPLPPYIHEKLKDRERYQTVYSKRSGSAAAPTAGLHFTPELLARIAEKQVTIARVLLHVGLGTFRPVEAENISEHVMHSEHYEMDEATAQLLNAVRARGGRIISVGTTTTRVLESVADENGRFKAQSGETSIFIYPGYTFHGIDAQITNFHLPRSTLLMMMSAFAGREEMLGIYRTAVEMKYRFFSFGDAMLIK